MKNYIIEKNGQKGTIDICEKAILELIEGIPNLTEYKFESRGIKCKKISYDIESTDMYKALMIIIDYGYYGNLASIEPIANSGDISNQEIPFYDLSGDIDELKMVAAVEGQYEPNNLDLLFNKFNSRFKMDCFRNKLDEIYTLHLKFEQTPRIRGLTIRDISILSEVSEKGIRNLMYSENPPAFKKISDGNPTIFDAQSIYDWLLTRPNFKPSCHISDDERVDDKSVMIKKGKVLVPVAKDGTWFCDEICKMAKGYYVGPKGEQECITGFVDALNRLKQLDIPRWRRKNAKGNFGVVTGVDWKWMPEKEVLPEGGFGK